MDLVKVDTSQLIPFLSLGRTILSAAFALWILKETYALLTRGRCNFAAPIVRVGFAYALLSVLPSIGAWAAQYAAGAAGKLMPASNTALFLQAYQHAVGGVMPAGWLDGAADAALGAVPGLPSPRGLITLFSLVVYACMYAAKAFVLGVLWHVCMSLVIVLGALAIPLGAVPGSKGLEGWLKNLLEVALWPIVFQVCIAMLLGSMSGLLQQVMSFDFGLLFTAPLSDGPAQLLVLLQWWAVCAAYCFIVFMTPVIASLAVRSTPVAIVGGLIAAQAISAGKAVAQTAAKVGLGKFAGLGATGSALGGRGAGLLASAGGQGGGGPSPVFRVAEQAAAGGSTLDTRDRGSSKGSEET